MIAANTLMKIRSDNIFNNIMIVHQRTSFMKSPSALGDAMAMYTYGEGGLKRRSGKAMKRHNGSRGLLLGAKYTLFVMF
jgi:hypothetical protein